MSIRVRGNQVAVEKLKKQSKKEEHFLKMPEVEEFYGTIRHVGPSAEKDLQVGQKVYFGTKYQNVKMTGQELCVMEDSNVLAVVQDEVPEDSNKQQ